MRASAFEANGTESSKSRMTASTFDASAFAITLAFIPGANNAVRISRIVISLIEGRNGIHKSVSTFQGQIDQVIDTLNDGLN